MPRFEVFDCDAIAETELFDGKLALIFKAPDLTAAEAVSRYKGLADIELGFRVLNSDFEIAPAHHRVPDRNRAHAMISLNSKSAKFGELGPLARNRRLSMPKETRHSATPFWERQISQQT